MAPQRDTFRAREMALTDLYRALASFSEIHCMNLVFLTLFQSLLDILATSLPHAISRRDQRSFPKVKKRVYFSSMSSLNYSVPSLSVNQRDLRVTNSRSYKSHFPKQVSSFGHDGPSKDRWCWKSSW